MTDSIGYLQKFKIPLIINWLKGYLLYFVDNKQFWRDFNRQTNEDKFLQALFYLVIIGLTISLFQLEMSFWEAVRVLVISCLFDYSVIISLFITNFIFKKYRKTSNFFSDVLRLYIFTELICFPFLYMLVFFFVKTEEYNFLLLFTIFSLGIIFYELIYSNIIFFNKYYHKLLAILFNLVLINLVIFISFNFFIQTETSKKLYRASILDPITNEFVEVQEKLKFITTIPSSRSVDVINNVYSELFTTVSVEQLYNTYNVEDDTLRVSYSATGSTDQNKSYLDSLNGNIKMLDSLSTTILFNSNKAILKSEKEFYLQLRELLINKIDVENPNIKLLANRNYKNEQGDIIGVEYLFNILDQSVIYLNDINKKRDNYTDNVDKAMSPLIVFNLILFYPINHFFSFGTP